MRHLEEAKQKREIPPPCDTHKYTTPNKEASLPNSESDFSQSERASMPSSPLNTSTPLSHSANSTQSNVTLPHQRWASKGEANAHTDRELEFTRVRTVPRDYDLDRSFSPSVSSLDASINHDSDDDCDTASNGGRGKPRIGPNRQADLEGLYGSELAEDNATLLWDPDTMGENQLDVLLAQCKVAESTFKAASVSSSAPVSEPVATQLLNSSLESETISASSSSAMSSSETDPNTAHFLSISAFLDIVHETRGSTSETVAQLKRRRYFGWSPLQSDFQVWNEDEMDRFEMGMASFPKQFDRIASLVRTRTAGECVAFYYSWKHSDRCRAWRGQIAPSDISGLNDAKEEEALTVPHSRMLPSHHYQHLQPPTSISTSRKRKRELDDPLDVSDRLYLEALGSLSDPAEQTDHLMLNLILNAPNTLVEDLDHHGDSVSSLDPLNVSLMPVALSQPPTGHESHVYVADPAPLSNDTVLLGHENQVSNKTSPSVECTHLDSQLTQSPIHGADTTQLNAESSPMASIPSLARDNSSASFSRYTSSASPKRAKVAEPDDHLLLHAVDMGQTSSNQAPTTVDPASLCSFFSPPEPTLDFFMHF